MAGGHPGLAPAFGFGIAQPPQPRGRAHASESWIVPAADIDAWLKIAKTGETFIYCHGPQLVQGAAAARVRDLAEAGEVIPHHKRADDGGFDFLVRRNRVRTVTAPRAPVIDPAMMAVMLVVNDAAQARRRCPSDAAIGEAASLRAPQVKWQLQKLKEARMIECRTVPAPGDNRFRVVRIVATGAETAGPAVSNEGGN